MIFKKNPGPLFAVPGFLIWHIIFSTSFVKMAIVLGFQPGTLWMLKPAKASKESMASQKRASPQSVLVFSSLTAIVLKVGNTYCQAKRIP